MEGWEFVVVAVAVVLLLGANRLPKIARSMGEARRELERVRAENDDTPDAPADAAPPPAVAAPEVDADAESTPAPPAAVAPLVEAAPLPPPLPPPAP